MDSPPAVVGFVLPAEADLFIYGHSSSDEQLVTVAKGRQSSINESYVQIDYLTTHTYKSTSIKLRAIQESEQMHNLLPVLKLLFLYAICYCLHTHMCTHIM